MHFQNRMHTEPVFLPQKYALKIRLRRSPFCYVSGGAPFPEEVRAVLVPLFSLLEIYKWHYLLFALIFAWEPEYAAFGGSRCAHLKRQAPKWAQQFSVLENIKRRNFFWKKGNYLRWLAVAGNDVNGKAFYLRSGQQKDIWGKLHNRRYAGTKVIFVKYLRLLKQGQYEVNGNGNYLRWLATVRNEVN